MREIADWLAEIGLAKYQTVFADNEIDWSLLPKLTEADLKELGLPLGPRKKLLEAVANLTAMPTQQDTEARLTPQQQLEAVVTQHVLLLRAKLVQANDPSVGRELAEHGRL